MLKFVFVILVIEVLQISAQCVHSPCPRYSSAPSYYSPAPSHYSQAPSHYSHAASHYSSAPHYSPAPCYSPTPCYSPQYYHSPPQPYPQSHHYSQYVIEKSSPCEDSGLTLSDALDQTMSFQLGNSLAQTINSIPSAAGGLLAGLGGVIA